MSMSVQDHPDYPRIRMVQANHGRALLERLGAHGLDIGWVDQAGDEPVPGLVVHVAVIDPDAHLPGEVEVIHDDGCIVRVPARVEVSPAATFESG